MKTIHITSLLSLCLAACGGPGFTPDIVMKDNPESGAGDAPDSGASDTDTGNFQGTLRASCYPNGTCNVGLTCVSDICVMLGDGDAGMAVPEAGLAGDSGVMIDSGSSPEGSVLVDSGSDAADCSVCPNSTSNIACGANNPPEATGNHCPCSCFINPDMSPTALGIMSCGPNGCACGAPTRLYDFGVDPATQSCIGSM